MRRQLKAAMKEFLTGDGPKTEVPLLWEKLESCEEFISAETILIYSSLPDEVPFREFIDKWMDVKHFVLPVVDGNDLLLRLLDSDTVMEKGYRGILEPSASAKQVDAGKIDLAVVPGLAFTKDGKRLGRGKGYYDRLLPSLHCPKIALAFSPQIIPHIPCDEWDIPLDRVIYNS